MAVVEPGEWPPLAAALFHQHPVLVALNRGETPRHQHVGRSARLQRAADVVAEIDDLRETCGGNIGQHRSPPGNGLCDAPERQAAGSGFTISLLHDLPPRDDDPGQALALLTCNGNGTMS